MKRSLVASRLGPQRMAGNPLGSGTAVVGHLGAVQSQLHDLSLWGLSMRSGLTRAQLAAQFEAGAFVRTHVLRPTWHHVLPADLPDLLELTAPRVRLALDSGGRTWGLSAAQRHAAADAVVDVVRAHGPLTRAQVRDHVVAAGLAGPGDGWVPTTFGHVLMEAEIRGAIASGPMRGKQHTYRALDLPPSSRTEDERLAWLAGTYVRGHGPSRPEDLAWWATLPITVARRAFTLAGLRPVTVAGVDLFTDDDADPTSHEVPAALLLPNFDELISYRRDPGDWGPQGTDAVLRAQGLLLFDGGLAGSWTRTESVSSVRIEVTTPLRVTKRAAAALEAAAARFGHFAGLCPQLRLP